MASDMILGIDQSLPLLLNDKSNQSLPAEKVIAVSNTAEAPAKDSKSAPVDTVSISTQSRQTTADARKEKTLQQEAQKTESGLANKSARSAQATAKVEFVYDLKGDLITRYLDSASRLVYQTPSEIMLNIKEFILKPDLSVDTKA